MVDYREALTGLEKVNRAYVGTENTIGSMAHDLKLPSGLRPGAGLEQFSDLLLQEDASLVLGYIPSNDIGVTYPQLAVNSPRQASASAFLPLTPSGERVTYSVVVEPVGEGLSETTVKVDADSGKKFKGRRFKIEFSPVIPDIRLKTQLPVLIPRLEAPTNLGTGQHGQIPLLQSGIKLDKAQLLLHPDTRELLNADRIDLVSGRNRIIPFAGEMEVSAINRRVTLVDETPAARFTGKLTELYLWDGDEDVPANWRVRVFGNNTTSISPQVQVMGQLQGKFPVQVQIQDSEGRDRAVKIAEVTVTLPESALYEAHWSQSYSYHSELKTKSSIQSAQKGNFQVSPYNKHAGRLNNLDEWDWSRVGKPKTEDPKGVEVTAQDIPFGSAWQQVQEAYADAVSFHLYRTQEESKALAMRLHEYVTTHPGDISVSFDKRAITIKSTAAENSFSPIPYDLEKFGDLAGARIEIKTANAANEALYQGVQQEILEDLHLVMRRKYLEEIGDLAGALSKSFQSLEAIRQQMWVLAQVGAEEILAREIDAFALQAIDETSAGLIHTLSYGQDGPLSRDAFLSDLSTTQPLATQLQERVENARKGLEHLEALLSSYESGDPNSLGDPSVRELLMHLKKFEN